MNMQEVLNEFESGLRIGLCEEDLVKTHDTLQDFVKAQGSIRTRSAHGFAFKKMAVVDDGNVRWAYIF